MSQPVKLPDELVLDARLAAGAAERSIAGQIEFWAQLGRAAEPLLTVVSSGKEASEPPANSAAAILRVLREPPHLSNDDVDALDRAIATGRQPTRAEGGFDEVDDE